ncbi:ATP-binding protein [Geomonas sp. RF6]|uniref:hybrid sensor histidine kinase/response regulator n=1 Tax=Geomonas sp. RF6 TaxID=2897342 RepID=UPI001E5AB02E|nr:ATP-binding protein [Geomonas sp. RF6]UFS70164.1 ATP-binding protein [Geomonas sp. RF6]
MNNRKLLSRLTPSRSSFQLKLFLLFTLLTFVLTALFVSLFVVREIRQHRREASEKLQLTANAFANSIRLPLYAENRELLKHLAEEIVRLPQVKAVEIVSANGAVLVRIPEVASAVSAHHITKEVEIRSTAAPLWPETAVGETDSAGDLIGTVRLSRGTEDLQASAQRVVVTGCAYAILFWLVVSFSCHLLLRRVTRSFQALMEGLERVHSGDYVSRIEVNSDDEPGRASAAVNVLAETLRQRDEENRRLNADLLEAVRQETASKERLVELNQALEEEVEERVQAQQELRNLVQQLPVGIVWSDTHGTVEYLNHFMLERIGYLYNEARTFDEWLSHACPDEAQRERVASLRAEAIAAWRGGATESSFYDVRVVCKDGSVRDLSCTNQLSGGRTVDILIDMTERELLQQQIIRNQKLESIGVLAGGIAHNFNNALTGVLGYISFARKMLGESHRAYELLRYAEKASKRAAGLATQLLTFASGGAPVKKVVSLVKLVEESVTLATTGSSVASRLEFPEALHNVYVDDGQICQAFNCICINAVQSMPGGGVLTVRGRNVSSESEKIPVKTAGEYVELSFIDRGCGISEEDSPKIFTPYFTTKAEVGTGLGLATAHSIITRHGGAITFSSTPGRGTTFTIYLPAIRKPEAPLQPEEEIAAAVSAEGTPVLVMDDEEIIRDLARDVLEKQGYVVTACCTGEEAVNLWREACEAGRPFEVGILDLTVPGGMGGRETAQQILKLHPGARLIVSSGYSNDPVMSAWNEHGFCAAYPKPYDADTLSRLLGQLGIPA